MNKPSFLDRFGWILFSFIVVVFGIGWYGNSYFNNQTAVVSPLSPPPPLKLAPLPSSSSSSVYSITDAPKHIGENGSVTGTITNIFTSKTGTVFFDYCQQYKTCPFSTVIFSANVSKFPILKTYRGKKVIVNGLIRAYNGQAEIIITDPHQIQLK